jgi:hypothetical protein
MQKKNKSSNTSPIQNELQELVRQNKYSEAVLLLFKQQSENWDLLKEGLNALTTIKTNKFYFKGYEIQTQFNPLRINSTSANVSHDAIKNRQCFLCIENLPEGQEGIIYRKKYSILCNPYPIFREHLTVSSTVHEPQRIKKSFKDLLRLTRDLNNYCFIYNGPESGASAPDHLHFQACKKSELPINMDYEGMRTEYGKKIINDNVVAYAINDGIRRILALESISAQSLVKSFNIIYGSYVLIARSRVEPMMNIISTYEEDSGWRVIIFLRKKHRPDAYFKEGDGNILVSPASIDLGGVLITPMEKDFKKIDKDIISGIFKEVAIGKEEFEYITTRLRG